MPARFGVAPSRFAAVAAATRARVRRPVIVMGGRRKRGAANALGFAARRAAAGAARRSAELPEALERLGVRTLGELAALPGCGAGRSLRDAPGCSPTSSPAAGTAALRPRPASEFVRESLELPEAASGIQLERGLGLLIDRVLARRERRGRTLRAVVLSAVLVEHGGTWREQVVFREALADPVRMRLALAPRLALMPAPAECSGSRSSASGRRRAISEPCSRTPPRRAQPGCARRSARPARPRGPMPPCACSRSIPTRAFPSGVPC